jgi:hypothetical protein
MSPYGDAIMRRISCLIFLIALLVIPSTATRGASELPALSLRLYSSDDVVVVGSGCPVVVELKNSTSQEVALSEPFPTRKVYVGANPAVQLPERDPPPDNTDGFTLQITSYVESEKRHLDVGSRSFEVDPHVIPAGKFGLMRIDVPAHLLELGKNRLRVTLYKGGKISAVSNVRVIQGTN